MSSKLLILFTYVFLSSVIITSCAGTGPSRRERSRVLLDLGSSLVLDGNPREALVHLLEAEKIDPSNHELQHQLALVYRDLGEYRLSLRHFQRAIDLNPRYPEAYNNMGILYSQQREWDKALESFEKAAADILYRTPHYAYHNIGSVYFRKGDYSRAIDNYIRAIKNAPDYISAYYDLASAYEAIEQLEMALDIYKQAATFSPQSLDINLRMSRLYLRMGRSREAAAELNHIIRSDPRSPQAKDAARLLREIQQTQ